MENKGLTCTDTDGNRHVQRWRKTDGLEKCYTDYHQKEEEEESETRKLQNRQWKRKFGRI